MPRRSNSFQAKLYYFLRGSPSELKFEEENSSFNSNKSPENEFASYERKIANNLGYFAVSRTRFLTDPLGNYSLVSTAPLAQLIYWSIYINTFIKAVFLMFLVVDYFGPVVFLDKIAALDYILCVGIATCGTRVWGKRYPMHEIMQSFWTVESSIFKALRCPQELKEKVEKRHRYTVWIHLGIVWIGCGCLVIQFYADPKYCAFTYSAFEWDSWWLRIIFCAHEFFFMMHPWNNMTGTSSLCTFEGVSLANLIEGMTASLKALCRKAAQQGYQGKGINKAHGRSYHSSKSRKWGDVVGDYNLDNLITHYKHLILVTDRFNEWIAYKVLALHMCGYFQFISDVFVAIQVLKLPGTGFMDVWFYLEDCFAGVYMIYRVYTFMSLVALRSDEFLRSLREYIRVHNKKRKLYDRIARTLKKVSLRLEPFEVTPMTVLTALDTFGNYYVCVAMWYRVAFMNV